MSSAGNSIKPWRCRLCSSPSNAHYVWRGQRSSIVIKVAILPVPSFSTSGNNITFKSVWMGKVEHWIIFSPNVCGGPLNRRTSIFRIISHRVRLVEDWRNISPFTTTSDLINLWDTVRQLSSTWLHHKLTFYDQVTIPLKAGVASTFVHLLPLS
jgi:hypothetical protein